MINSYQFGAYPVIDIYFEISRFKAILIDQSRNVYLILSSSILEIHTFKFDTVAFQKLSRSATTSDYHLHTGCT